MPDLAPDFLQNPPLFHLIRARLRQTLVAREVYRWKWPRRGDVLVLSFPKAGRTWLRVMMGKAMTEHFRIPRAELLELDRLADRQPGVPRIKFKHDDNPHLKTPGELVRTKTEYRGSRVVLLVRDPRDLIVSNYFEFTRRQNQIDRGLPAYIDQPRGGLQTILRFHNIWAASRHLPKQFLLVRYEDLHTDAAAQLRRVLEFAGIPNVSDPIVRDAVEFGSFQNMRKLEASNALDNDRLKPADPADPDSYKTRRGRVGGYREYLDPQQTQRIDHAVRTGLDPLFGYA